MDQSDAFSISAIAVNAVPETAKGPRYLAVARAVTLKTILVLGLMTATCVGQAFAADAPLTLERKIPLGAIQGRIDHFAVDLARHRLFVAELGNDSVGVVDLKSDTVVHRIAGLKEPQGLGYLAKTDTLYVANAGDGSVRLYRGEDFAPRSRFDLGADADNVRVDDMNNRVWIGYGGGALAALDGDSGRKIAYIALKAHPESFRLEPGGGKIFANIPGVGQIAIVDVGAGKQIATIATHGDRGNFPMALDTDRKRLLVVFRDEPKLAVYTMADGRPVASVPVCSDADDVFLDAKRRRVYVSCGAGAVDVLGESGDGYQRIAHIATASGARTSLFVPELDRLYLGVRASGGEAAAIWIFRPGP